MTSIFDLLQGLLNESTRVQAEATVNQLKETHPTELLVGLSNLVQLEGTNNDIKSFALVLLKRFALEQRKVEGVEKETSIISTIGNESISQIKSNLIVSLQHPLSPETRRKLCYAISDIAVHLSDKGSEWQELETLVYNLAFSSDPCHRDSAYLIIESYPGVLDNVQPNRVNELFTTGLKDTNMNVAVNCVGATCMYLEEAENCEQFTTIINLIMNILGMLFSLGDPQLENTLRVLSYSTDFAVNHAKMFKPQLKNISTFACEIMKNKAADESIQQAVLEFILTLMEQVPGMIKKLTTLHQDILPILIQWLTMIEDDQDWYTTDVLDDDEFNDNSAYAEQAIDRISLALGGKLCLPVCFSLIPSMLGNQDWKQRHAALYTITCIAEGSQNLMRLELSNILSLITPHFSDPHPRVRFAAAHCIGQLCTDFAPMIQQRYASNILPLLITLLQDGQPRIQSHAAAALVNFCDECKEKQIMPYVDTLVRLLMGLLSSPILFLREQTLTTLATVADSAQAEFVKYYSEIMPILVIIMQQACSKEERTLRARAVECSSLIALSVGKQVFMSGAAEILSVYRDIQSQVVDVDDPVGSYLLTAWGRMCKVMGEDFHPYLDYVMRPLLITAALEPEIIDIQDLDESAYSEEEGWTIFGKNGKRFAIKQSCTEDKNTAIQLLMTYARDTKKNFAPYLQETWKIILQAIKYYLSDDVRLSAYTCIPYLFGVMKSCEADCQDMWTGVLKNLLERIGQEPEPFIVPHIFITIHESINELGASEFNAECVGQITVEIEKQLRAYDHRQKLWIVKKRDPEFDAEDEENMMMEEEEELLIGAISKVVHYLIRTYVTNYFPYLDALVPLLNQFAQDTSVELRQISICVWDDVIEFCGNDGWKYSPYFGPLILSALEDKAAELRQAAAYGVGVAAQCGPVYAQFYQACLKGLFTMCSLKNSRDGENIFATENAISAIGKICKYGDGGKDLIDAWVRLLPIQEDYEECEPVYSYFCDIIESGVCTDVKIIVNVCSTALTAGVVEDQLEGRMVAILKGVIHSCDDAMKQNLWQGLSDESKALFAEKQWI